MRRYFFRGRVRRATRAQGKRIGRPALDPALQRKIAKQLEAGLSAYAVAKQLGINAHTVAKHSPFDAGAGGA
jgi:DNA-binding CsgD family transcriptional regulator